MELQSLWSWAERGQEMPMNYVKKKPGLIAG